MSDLPELPEPNRKVHMGGGKFQLFFSEQQMRAYALAAVAMERERCLAIVCSVNNYDNPMTASDCANAIRAGD